jgi:hypothetical protein
MTRKKTPVGAHAIPTITSKPKPKRARLTEKAFKALRDMHESKIKSITASYETRLQGRSDRHVEAMNAVFQNRVRDVVAGALAEMADKYTRAAVDLRRKNLEMGYDHENLPSACAVTQRAGAALSQLMSDIIEGKLKLKF